MRRSTLLFLFILLIASFVCGLTYVIAQQNIRSLANDPQIQMAEDATEELAIGQMPQAVFMHTVDLAKSLAPFLILYTEDGKPLLSSGMLNGNIPVPPTGVFDFVKKNGEDRITWQPKSGVRIAAVVKRADGLKPGFVLAGRSLREIEKREDMLIKEIGISWIVFVVLSLILISFAKKRNLL